MAFQILLDHCLTQKKLHMNVFFVSLVAVFIHWMGGKSTPVASCKAGEPVASNLILTSSDGGKTWTDFSKGLPHAKEIRHILVTDKETYVAVEMNQLYRMVSEGVWQKESIGGSIMGAVISQDSSFQPNYFMGIFEGREGPYVSIHESGLFQRNASGHWLQVHTDLPGNKIYHLAELADGSILVGTEGGVFKKSGKDRPWENVLNVRWASNTAHHGNVVVTSTPEGLWVSHDYGTNWSNTLKDKLANYELSATKDKIFAIRPILENDNKEESNQFMENAFVSKDQGKTWTPINKGVMQVEKLYQVLQTGSTLFSSNNEGIGISKDQGFNWENIFGKPGSEDMTIWKLYQRGSVVYAAKSFRGC